MGDELAIDVEIVFSSRDAECRHIDWHMQDAEEGESKHGRNGLCQRAPIHRLHVVESVEMVPRASAWWRVEHPSPVSKGLDRDVECKLEEVEQESNANEIPAHKEITFDETLRLQEHDGQD